MTPVEQAVWVCITHGLPLALRGRPGVGKTSLVEATAQRLGLSCEVVVGSLREPTDFAGLPVVDREGHVRLAPPAWAVRASSAVDGSVILLDELTTASPAVQAAMLRVVRERVVGEAVLPPHVRIVAAYNDADDCGGFELELPMRSRLIHLTVSPDIDVFTRGITEGWNVDSARRQSVDMAAVAGHRQRWANLVAAFIRSRPTLLENPPERGTWGGYPTPRTWEMAVIAAAASDASGMDEEVRGILVQGCIGAAAAAEFLAFVDSVDLPDPDGLLRDPSGAENLFESTRPDRNMVILLEVAQAVGRCCTVETWQNSWVVAAHAVRAGFGDLVAWAYRPVPSLKPSGAVPPEEFATVAGFLAGE